MNNEATLEKMKSLRLNGMANSFQNMISNGNIHDFEGDELIAHLIDAEYDEKHNRRINSLIKIAGFRMNAHIEEIRYDSGRGLTKSQVLKLCDFNWLKTGTDIIICGPTGVGKSYLCCALGMKACMMNYKVKYYSFNKFLGQMKYEKSIGNYKTIERMSKKDLIILDDFGLEKMDKDSRMILFELIEEKNKFPWPANEIEAREITYDELKMLLDGINFFTAYQELNYEHVI